LQQWVEIAKHAMMISGKSSLPLKVSYLR